MHPPECDFFRIGTDLSKSGLIDGHQIHIRPFFLPVPGLDKCIRLMIGFISPFRQGLQPRGTVFNAYHQIQVRRLPIVTMTIHRMTPDQNKWERRIAYFFDEQTKLTHFPEVLTHLIRVRHIVSMPMTFRTLLETSPGMA
ncbi:MAG: hypothetical protein SFY92_01690 [Verrucomicrobiae bacterium]|nr:hypothetical protein [Verrucomicrobiae bacterium]